MVGLNFFVSIIPMGVIVSWIYLKNGKSVIAAILFHFIINISQEMWAISQTTKCIETVVMFLVAAAIVIWDKKMFGAGGYPERRQARNLLLLDPVNQ